jgi:hypothetical protein
VTFDEAMEIVHAAHEPEPESNVIFGVDFINKSPKDKDHGAL